jgi:hypothetical protein
METLHVFDNDALYSKTWVSISDVKMKNQDVFYREKRENNDLTFQELQEHCIDNNYGGFFTNSVEGAIFFTKEEINNDSNYDVAVAPAGYTTGDPLGLYVLNIEFSNTTTCSPGEVGEEMYNNVDVATWDGYTKGNDISMMQTGCPVAASALPTFDEATANVNAKKEIFFNKYDTLIERRNDMMANTDKYISKHDQIKELMFNISDKVNNNLMPRHYYTSNELYEMDYKLINEDAKINDSIVISTQYKYMLIIWIFIFLITLLLFKKYF